jgi:small-conductance mechanosensitive channel
MENQSSQPPKRNSNVIYFLIVVVLALLATDVYLYLQKNQSAAKVVYQTDQRAKLQTALDSLESQIKEVTNSKTKLSADMQAKNDSLESKIKVLRQELASGKLTQGELDKAQEDVKQLRYFVTKYTADIDELQKKNVSLTTERDTLKTTLVTVTKAAAKKDSTLTKQNADLDAKVKVGSAIKLATSDIVAYKIKGSGKEVDTKRSSVAKKIKINFTVASNSLAAKAMHDIYIRVIDPTGNLLTATDSGNFNSDGQDLQFTYKTSIDFKDDGTSYTIDWVNPVAFQKGSYTVMLYADGYTMGKSSFELK